MRTVNIRIVPGLVLLCVAVQTCALACAERPSWAKKATAFPQQCSSNSQGAAHPCKPLEIIAPDGRRSVRVRYRKTVISGTDWLFRAYIRVKLPGKQSAETPLPESFKNVELLWAPNSRAFFVNGDGDGAPVAGFWVYAYMADDPGNPRNITENAQRDMVKEFPTDREAWPNGEDLSGCKPGSRYHFKRDADSINVTGIDWLTPSSILIVAEIPCDTLYGGIMCQTNGYEVEVPTGRILKRIDARHLKSEFQPRMAWNFRVPKPPKYCATDSSPEQKPPQSLKR